MYISNRGDVCTNCAEYSEIYLLHNASAYTSEYVQKMCSVKHDNNQIYMFYIRSRTARASANDNLGRYVLLNLNICPWEKLKTNYKSHPRCRIKNR